MKKTLSLILAILMAFTFVSCDKKGEEYTGKLGVYDAVLTVNGDDMLLTLNIEEKGAVGLVVKNVVKITGSVKKVNGSFYDVCFADENTVISMSYEVTGKNADGYMESLTELLLLVAKTDADKELVRRLGKGEEISFGIDSALYTGISGMPGDVTVRLFEHEKTFTISN